MSCYKLKSYVLDGRSKRSRRTKKSKRSRSKRIRRSKRSRNVNKMNKYGILAYYSNEPKTPSTRSVKYEFGQIEEEDDYKGNIYYLFDAVLHARNKEAVEKYLKAIGNIKYISEITLI